MKMRLLIPLIHLLAFWPLGPWYWRRVTNTGGEPWCVLPLSIAFGFVFWSAVRMEHGDGRTPEPRLRLPLAPLRASSLAPAVLLTVLYAALYPFLPQLACCVLAVTALTSSLSVCILNRRFHAGLWGVLLLSLPLMDSLDFYAGFPLRMLVAQVAAALLNLAGMAVKASGAALDWHGSLIAVDAPCSGIRMLWTSGLIIVCAACFRNFSTVQLIRAGVWSLAIVVAGNTIRTASLFVTESTIIPAPPWFHTSAGLIVFAATVVALFFVVRSIAARPRPEPAAIVPETTGSGSCTLIPLAAAGLLAAAVPLLSSTPVASHEGFPGWPETFEGRRLEALPLSPAETRFERSFPGRIGRFTDGERTIVFRWVNRPSRQMHPADVCFRALGFSVQPAPLFRDGEGRLWNTFQAWRGIEVLRVRSLFRDSSGKTWPDVSGWFWASVSGRSVGPWWAVTVAERASEPVAVSRTGGGQ